MKFQDATTYSVEMLSSPDFRTRVQEEDVSMLKHLDILKKINAAGFLTVNSQGGRKSSGISKKDGKPYEIHERAYLMGFMKEEKAVEFLRRINIYTDKNAIFVPYCEDSIYIPSSLDIPLTVTKKGQSLSVNTHTSSALPLSTWTSFRKQANINKSEKIVFVQCWDTKWNRGASTQKGLFKDVLKCLL